MNLNSLTLEQILNTEGLPPRLIVFFASQCARDSMSKTKVKDPGSLTAIEVSERYGNGEDFSEEYFKKVVGDAYASAFRFSTPHATDAAYASAACAYRNSYVASAAASYSAAFVASSSAAASYTAAYASAAYASVTYYSEIYKPLLIEIIESRLSKVEKLLIFG